MGRLIDADKLIEDLQSQMEFDKYTPNSTEAMINLETLLFIDKIKEQPTAYDVDKVVEELKTTRIALEKANGYLEATWKLGYQKAIEDFEKEMIRSSLTEREKEYIRYKAEQLKEGGIE